MNRAGAVALVTGGSSGLGLATVERLRDDGAEVVIVDLPTSSGEVAAEQLGPGVTFAPADVTVENDVARVLDLAATIGSLRVVVNCAGIGTPGRVYGRNGPLAQEVFARVIAVNLIGTFNVIRLAVPHLIAHEPLDEEQGVIVNTASVAAFDGQIGQVAYSASKGGVAAMTLPLARELATHRIRVVAVAPGIFDTPMIAGLPEEAQRTIVEQVPHPSRLGRPSEFAALVAHIVQNPMLNGEVVRLDAAARMPPRSR